MTILCECSISGLCAKLYFFGNVIALSLLTLLFKLDFLQIQWVGAVVIGLFFTCFGYIILTKYKVVSEIASSPEANEIDFNKIELTK